jgi:hypothetical protein
LYTCDMFRQKTTIIIGAGASCELGLPSGDSLKFQIARLLRPAADNAYGFEDETMAALMRQRCPNVWDYEAILGPLKEAAARIRKGLPLAVSIDNFLYSHQGDGEIEQLGKLAIAICILRSEKSSHLFNPVPAIMQLSHPQPTPTLSIDGNELAKSWYPIFAQLLMSGIQRGDIASAFRNLRFIIFNYDRCFEQFIWMALQNYFDIGTDQASEILDNVSFIHPYGDLGALPWQSDTDSVAFGDCSITDLTKMIPRIRTFTESVQSDVGGNVKDAVEWAETLLILGFGYLDQNIQLLSPTTETRSNRVFSTAYGISPYDYDVIKDTMINLGGVSATDAIVEQGTCRNLFENFRLNFSLA